MSRQKILISACLLGEDCKYNGGNNADKISAQLLEKIAQNFDLIAVCPEQLGGLPTPREPAEICKDGRVVTKFSKTDVSENFKKGAQICVQIARENGCKIAILKDKSPSCGSERIYDGGFTGALIKGQGVTTKELQNAQVTVFSEGRLREILKIAKDGVK